MDYWVYAIPLAAIIGGITVAIFAMYFKTKKDIAMATGPGATRAAEDSAEVNRQVLARLDSLDARLAAIESKVTRVP
ncbi:hypothetical protein [Cryobacterium tagatosivorans]|uniref:Uncharacterized protein n=1 Tax=Cryobacterium tagatosivorans TaxID=1259199 RepID=A0A4R8UE47_9MICO|nr:hypothetical protein [Cryobacterium tagatosivorans]TFB51245.1 hypothetical protein E3O23_08795 [Cryobacterium tagatosivorans]